MRHLLLIALFVTLAACTADHSDIEPAGPQHLYFEGGTPSDRGAWLAAALTYNEQVGEEAFVVHMDGPMGAACGAMIRQVAGLADEGYASVDGCVSVVEYGRAGGAAYMTMPVLGELLGLDPGEVESNVLTEESVARIRARL
jgi:hypothetical protein